MVSKFRKDDNVKVIYGKDKGKITQIIKCFPKIGKVLLNDVNIVKKHVKPNKSNPEGGIVKKEMPIHISNIMHFDTKLNTVTKVGVKMHKEQRSRFYKKSGDFIDNKQ